LTFTDIDACVNPGGLGWEASVRLSGPGGCSSTDEARVRLVVNGADRGWFNMGSPDVNCTFTYNTTTSIGGGPYVLIFRHWGSPLPECMADDLPYDAPICP
jgi:hypothetical protein